MSGGPVEWTGIYEAVVKDLDASVSAGRRHLLTEDSIRAFTIDALVDRGVDPRHLEIEWRSSVQRGVMHDLVIDTPPSTIVEFKFPRSPRVGNMPLSASVLMGAVGVIAFTLPSMGLSIAFTHPSRCMQASFFMNCEKEYSISS